MPRVDSVRIRTSESNYAWITGKRRIEKYISLLRLINYGSMPLFSSK